MKTKACFFLAGVLLTSLVFLSVLLLYRAPVRVHRLTAPLYLNSETAFNGVLPSGTLLYYERSYAEGVSRYRVYLNIDRLPLELSVLHDPTVIDPLDAHAPIKPEKDVSSPISP